MAENNVIVASAVVIPEAVEDSIPTATGATKRRQSPLSDSEGGEKRRRLSGDSEAPVPSQNGHPNAQNSPMAPTEDSAPSNEAGERRSSRSTTNPQGKEEERKRGRRLFGSLLGTLSQSSSTSTKQKRRADIDRKQQEKLRLQEEEYDEEKKRRLDELMITRRKEQVLWDEESMHLKHSNMLATAHFLKTETTPILYFKPWELTSEDKGRVETQIQEAEKLIAQELGEHPEGPTSQRGPALEGAHIDGASDASQMEPLQASATEEANDEPHSDGKVDPVNGASADRAEDVEHINKTAEEPSNDSTKDVVEDNEEVVVEAGEDAVIW